MKKSVVVIAALAFSVGAVVAQQDLVKQNQATMKGNGRAIGGMVAMVKGEKPYDQATVDDALKQLADTAQKLPTMFPESVKGLKADGDYSSSPKIWEDKAGFDARIVSFGKAVADARASAKNLDSLKTSVTAIGKECGGCHETFRHKES
jgi:cytochrome c556